MVVPDFRLRKTHSLHQPRRHGCLRPTHFQQQHDYAGLVLAQQSEWERLIVQPDEISDMETQSPYIIVTDADAVYRQAKANGAKIAVDIKDE